MTTSRSLLTPRLPSARRAKPGPSHPPPRTPEIAAMITDARLTNESWRYCWTLTHSICWMLHRGTTRTSRGMATTCSRVGSGKGAGRDAARRVGPGTVTRTRGRFSATSPSNGREADDPHPRAVPPICAGPWKGPARAFGLATHLADAGCPTFLPMPRLSHHAVHEVRDGGRGRGPVRRDRRLHQAGSRPTRPHSP